MTDKLGETLSDNPNYDENSNQAFASATNDIDKTLMTALTISMTEIIQKIVVGQTGHQHHLLIQKYQRV